jgi:glyoxylase-like metal-dependent hydrolase (beta-lactamase superfamily II)
MFAEPPPPVGDIRTTNALKNAKTVIIENKDYDVFGDGSVMLLYTPGHTPGHQSMFLKLPKTGPVILTGDLYASADQRKPPYDQMNPLNTSKEETIASRTRLEEYAKTAGATVWVHHDVPTIKALKKSPEYYE